MDQQATTQFPGIRFRQAIQEERPLQIVGAINAYAAIMAEAVGFRALYLSGAGVANACYGLPDLGLTSLDNVLEEARRITDTVDLPLLVDIDTGWGTTLSIARTIRLMERAGVAAIHIEDQPQEKRCGHRHNKKVVSSKEMVDRLKAVVDTRKNSSFVIMARTDAYSVEGIDKMLERCVAYEQAGADAHFLEALSSLEEYQQCVKILQKPVLANITEFGKTPLFTREELAAVGVKMILYPLSAWRAMNFAALHVFQTIRQEGSQQSVLGQMQTREELYHFLRYIQHEQHLDREMGKNVEKEERT